MASMTNEQLEQIVVKTSVQCEQNANDIKEITATLKAIADKLDSKTSTNWGVIWSSLGVVAIFVAGAWALVNTQIGAAKEQTGTFIKSEEARLQQIENITMGELKAKARYWDDFVYSKVAP